LLFSAFGSIAQSVELSPGEDIRAALAALRPGDELVLGGGVYSFDSNFTISATGTLDQPIVIRARTGETPVLQQNNANQNAVEIRNSRYLILRGIEVTGGSHGIRLMDSSFITIEECNFHETGDVGLSANSGGTYEGLKILRNEIHHTHGTGEGMYLGCNNDACRVKNSLIDGNYIHHTNGPGVEQGDGIELKEGSSGNVISNNVIHDTNYPGILTYSTVGNGPANRIEGNLIWHTNDNGIQVAADAILINNIVLGSPVAFQPHQAGSPSHLELLHNTLVSRGSAVNVRGVSGDVVIANNAIYSETGPAINLISGNTSLVRLSGNVGHGGVSGASGGYSEGQGVVADFVNGHYLGAPPVDVFPSSDSALIGAGDSQFQVPTDFNGTPRNGRVDAGAYHFTQGGNPGWEPAEGFKGGAVPGSRVVPEQPKNLRFQSQ